MSVNLTAIADILDRAANHIDTVGWWQGSLYNAGQVGNGVPLGGCAVCMLGALNVAIHGTPMFPNQGIDGHDAAWHVMERLGFDPDHDTASWNDADGRTQAEVTAALRETAAELRGGAA